MPLKLIKPTEQDFVLERSDKLFGTDGEPTRITIRQATQAANERRSRISSEVTRVMSVIPTPDEELQFRQNWSPEVLKRYEVFLTLIACNILDEEGQQLFRFRNSGNHTVLDMSDAEFEKAWGKLPPQIAEEIHEKVLQVNVTWAGPLGNLN